jgi:hypothetical protein
MTVHAVSPSAFASPSSKVPFQVGPGSILNGSNLGTDRAVLQALLDSVNRKLHASP